MKFHFSSPEFGQKSFPPGQDLVYNLEFHLFPVYKTFFHPDEFQKPTSLQVIHLSLPKPPLMVVSRVTSLEVLHQCYST